MADLPHQLYPGPEKRIHAYGTSLEDEVRFLIKCQAPASSEQKVLVSPLQQSYQRKLVVAFVLANVVILSEVLYITGTSTTNDNCPNSQSSGVSYSHVFNKQTYTAYSQNISRHDKSYENSFYDSDVSCRFPKIPLYNDEVKPFLKNVKEINCTKDLPQLFKMDYKNNLHMLKNVSNYHFGDCCYMELQRKTDFETVVSDKCHKITLNVTKINKAFRYIGVKCINKLTKKDKFLDMFAMTNASVKKIVKGKQQDKINLIILGVDATSHNNFKRLMPKTLGYLTRNLQAIGLQRLNKNGENTLPNLITALTGYSLPEIEKRCWKSVKNYFDSCPFIWKRFSSEGYVTSWADDLANLSTFNYRKLGFSTTPTDFYLRPVTILQRKELSSNYRSGVPQCFGPRTPTEVMLDYMERLTQSFEENRQKYFQFYWSAHATHSSMTQGVTLDNIFFSTLERLNDNNFLNNTVLIVMSDHGFRFGGYRNTYSGDLESKLPFAYFTFPVWFRQKFPMAIKNFEMNAQFRLTSYFDFYRTLKDLLYLDWSAGNGRIEERTKLLHSYKIVPKSISLFLPVPKSRTCQNAGIPVEFCVCNSLPKVNNLQHPVLQNSAQFLIEKINNVIVGQTSCAKLKLGEIVNANGLIDDEVHEYNGNDFFHSIVIRTTPGNATFEAMLVTEKNNLKHAHDLLIHASNNLSVNSSIGRRSKVSRVKWRLIGDITRTNSYKNQSDCVNTEVLKFYCYCV